ncbi:hypothetical protein Deipr_1272 [Deinococcus proteolyticus MRP]|uniref:Uncharacterized protein n=1 Tax=Deinococcus proteolyticus (strain ATCC 35074 / DSM 20540 / JCM 6276 / NBRC 101906 / NCIMB 13154 / VKM Ac-1939 / CCM 2703 / MRP) TaxID=693977 RepID=F0RP78_DEIPM|nr:MULTISPECIES: hypothetical protein [Deinococcus]ADY26421.1 hypothetical protein Deipr_1272 [Deinococcus proteolyticus MRP]MCY1702541.1 hypothetical protein [Deinococcus sp. SL84]
MALAVPAHAVEGPPVFAGAAAWPIVPSTRCPNLWHAVSVRQASDGQSAQLYHYGAQLQTGQPLQAGAAGKAGWMVTSLS